MNKLFEKDEIIIKAIDKTIVNIEDINGIKYIHYMGFGYYVGEPVDKPYRWVSYTWLICPLSVALEYGVTKYEEDNQELVKQYIDDMSEEEIIEDIFREDAVPIMEKDITTDIPCGTYIIID
ncbi:MAG: hypothetical protein LUH07_10245 [Lachnospiraceae bacterium]|nr:hypothetical protein [Lachnospiraceae bacterium]